MDAALKQRPSDTLCDCLPFFRIRKANVGNFVYLSLAFKSSQRGAGVAAAMVTPERATFAAGADTSTSKATSTSSQSLRDDPPAFFHILVPRTAFWRTPAIFLLIAVCTIAFVSCVVIMGRSSVCGGGGNTGRNDRRGNNENLPDSRTVSSSFIAQRRSESVEGYRDFAAQSTGTNSGDDDDATTIAVAAFLSMLSLGLLCMVAISMWRAATSNPGILAAPALSVKEQILEAVRLGKQQELFDSSITARRILNCERGKDGDEDDEEEEMRLLQSTFSPEKEEEEALADHSRSQPKVKGKAALDLVAAGATVSSQSSGRRDEGEEEEERREAEVSLQLPSSKLSADTNGENIHNDMLDEGRQNFAPQERIPILSPSNYLRPLPPHHHDLGALGLASSKKKQYCCVGCCCCCDASDENDDEHTQEAFSRATSDAQLGRVEVEENGTGGESKKIDYAVMYRKWCRTCEFRRPPRAAHCRVCNCCIGLFDHHCGVTGACIGALNARYFASFLVSLALLIDLILIVSIICFYYVHDDRLMSPPAVASLFLIIATVLSFIQMNAAAVFYLRLYLRWGITLREYYKKGSPYVGYELETDLRRIPRPFDRGSVKENCKALCFPSL